ncbi:hypothetical protein DM860_002770 [Cuscuta australis]|uniref:Protein SCAR n=1 Tax=Cuscuta australis TaxID=267555 RepID=A0A328D0G0_9ASTE|nr:hypothetical protein DM860_002770 [Cuscuta australis]
MPLSRYKIRNEFSLADPDLYGSAYKDDPEAVLEAVAMAGLVGVLRQLGDLAEFAAEIFHDLHEEVLATATRGHSLTIRVQQLEADFPSIENVILSQTSHSSFFYNSGTDWHPNLHMDQNLVTQGDLPRFVMDSYEECRGPPRLFLLDKFDIAGAGACLKRYTDPSFFKQEASSFEMINSSFHRERRTRKAKKKGQRGRNSQTPEVLPTSHVKLHQLFMEEELIENGNNDSRRHVKLKRRLNGFPFDSKTGKSYMEKFLRTPSPEHKAVHEVCVESVHLKLPLSSAYETEPDYSGTRKASGDEKLTHSQINLSPSLSLPQSEENDVLEQLNDAPYEAVTDDDVLAISTCSLGFDVGDNLRSFYKVATGNEVLINGEDTTGDITKDYHSDDVCSEAENYMDALASMDSEVDTDSELRARTHSPALNREKRLTTNLDQIRSRSCDSQSVGNSTSSDDANSVSKKEESSFSSSASPCTSVETTAPLEGHAANMTEIREIQMCSPVDSQHIGESVASAHPSEHAFFDVSTEAAEHHSQSYDLEQSSTSTLQDCSLNQGIVKARTVTNEDALVKPTISETLSTLNKDEFNSAGVAKMGVSQHMVASAPIELVNPSQQVGDLPPIVSAESELLVHLPNILEASLEEEHIKHDLCIASLEECAEDNCSHIREYHIDSPNLPVVQIENKPLDSDSKHDTVHTSVNLDETLRFEEENAKGTCGTLSDGKVGPPNLSIMQTAPRISGMTHPIPLLDTRELIISQSMQANLDEALEKRFAEKLGHFHPGPSLTEGETSALSPYPDLTSEEKPSVLHVRVTEAHRLNDGGMSASLGIEGLQDDSGGLNEVGHHSTYLHQHDTDGYGHFQPEVLTWDPNKTSSMELPFEQSSLNVDQRSFDGNNFRDAMGHTSHLQDHSCAEHEPDMPRYEFDHEEELGKGGTDSKHFPHKDQELFCQGDQDAIFDTSSKFVVTNILDQLPFPEGNCEDSSSSLASQHEKQKVVNKCSQLDKELLVGDEGISTSVQPHQSEQRQLSCFTEFERSVNPSKNEKTEMPIHCSLPKLLPQEYHEGFLYVPSHDCAGVPGHVYHDESFDYSPKTTHENPPCQPSVPRLFPEGNNTVNIFEQCNNPFTCVPPGGGVHLGTDQTNLEEMPPLPPLPPVQWRIGKFQHALSYERDNNNITPEMMKNEACVLPSLPSKFDQAVRPLVKLPSIEITDEGSPLAYQNDAMYDGSFPSHMPNEVYDENDEEFFDVLAGVQPLNSFSQVIHVDKSHTISSKTSSGEHDQPAEQLTDDTSLNEQEPEKDFKNLEETSTASNRQGSFVSSDDSASMGSSLLANTGSTSLEENFTTEIESVQPEHPIALDHQELAKPESHLASETGSNGLNLDKASVISQENLFRHETIEMENESTQPEHQIGSEMNLKESECEKGSAQVEENTVRGDTLRSVLEAKLRNPLHRKPNLDGDILWPAVEDGAVNENKKMKLPRPRSPLIDAVAAHDKSKMRKVNDRVKPPVQKADERNNLLEQIRSKSFSLKPTVVTRPPSVQAPQTNLKVAAILERAKTIRQAFAGSDEEEDEDSWD